MNNNEIEIMNDIIENTDTLTVNDIIDELSSERDMWKTKYTYTLADHENYKRNTQKRIDSLYDYGTEKIIRDILPIIDDFERCLGTLSSSEKECDTEGIKLIYANLMNTLTTHGISVINPAENDMFDSNYHEAISCIQSDDNELEGKIAQCFTKGYILKDKVIRYAKVIVYKVNN